MLIFYWVPRTVKRLYLKKFRHLFRQFCEKIAKSPREVHAQVATVKNLKKHETGGFARSGAKLVIPNLSLESENPPKQEKSLSTTWLTVTVLFSLCFYFIIIVIVFAFVYFLGTVLFSDL